MPSSAEVTDESLGESGQLEGKQKEPEFDAATILKVEIAFGEVDDYVCSGTHTGETGFLDTSGT